MSINDLASAGFDTPFERDKLRRFCQQVISQADQRKSELRDGINSFDDTPGVASEVIDAGLGLVEMTLRILDEMDGKA